MKETVAATKADMERIQNYLTSDVWASGVAARLGAYFIGQNVCTPTGFEIGPGCAGLPPTKAGELIDEVKKGFDYGMTMADKKPAAAQPISSMPPTVTPPTVPPTAAAPATKDVVTAPVPTPAPAGGKRQLM